MSRGREQVINSRDPRQDAINFVSNDGKNKLNVTKWLDAGRPGGSNSHYSYDAFKTRHDDPRALAKKGFTGYVAETGQAFTVRDDYDYANRTSGKGYHVNAMLGQDRRAYTMGPNSSENQYIDRTNMTGERYYHDGPEAAAKWYQGQREKPDWGFSNRGR